MTRAEFSRRPNHYAQEAEARPTPVCPSCGQKAEERRTRYGIRCQCCGLWSWDRHPLADAATHEARKAAHAAFDELWKSGAMSRGKAYALLRKELGIGKDECHIKLMDAELAGRVPDAVAAIWDTL